MERIWTESWIHFSLRIGFNSKRGASSHFALFGSFYFKHALRTTRQYLCLASAASLQFRPQYFHGNSSCRYVWSSASSHGLQITQITKMSSSQHNIRTIYIYEYKSIINWPYLSHQHFVDALHTLLLVWKAAQWNFFLLRFVPNFWRDLTDFWVSMNISICQ